MITETAVSAYLRRNGIKCVITGMLDDAAQCDGQVSVYGTNYDVQVGVDYLALNQHDSRGATDLGTFKTNAQGLGAIVEKLKSLMAQPKPAHKVVRRKLGKKK